MNPAGRSLEIVAVGLGQAGGNLAAEFHRRGYRAIAFNTARTDLSTLGAGQLGLPEADRIYIGLDGYDGAGSDTAYGRHCIAEHAERIRSAVERHTQGADVVVLAAGLGGGTGSCVAALAQALDELGLPAVVLTPLPHQHESGIAKVNALRGVKALSEAPSYGWVMIDNARLARSHQDVPIDSYFETINRSIVEPLDRFNRLNDREGAHALRALDGEDFRNLLLAGGVLGYQTTELSELTSDAVLDGVQAALADNAMMPGGSDLAQVAYLGLVIEASESALASTPFAIYEQVAERLKAETGGAAVYVGLYRVEGAAPAGATLRLLYSSSALPSAISRMLEEAQREAGTLQEKLHQSVQSLDLGELDAMRLQRRTVPRHARGGDARSAGPARSPAASAVAPAKAAPAPAAPTPSPSPEAGDEDPRPGGTVASILRRAPEGDPPPPPVPPPAAISEAEPEPEPVLLEEVVEVAPKAPVRESRPQPVAATAPEPSAAAEPDATPHGSLKEQRLEYERLVNAFRSSTVDEKRSHVARQLEAGFHSDEPLVRFYAVHAMARLDPAYFRDALQAATEDADVHVADLARRSLANAS